MKTVPRRNLRNWIHIAHLAEDVYGNDRFGAGGDCAFDQSRIDVERAPVDVDKYRLRAGSRYRACSRKKSEWSGDDLVTLSDVKRHQRCKKRIGSTRYANPEAAV